GDAALFAIGVAAQRVLAPEARRVRHLLERVVDGLLGGEEILHRQEEGANEFPQQETIEKLSEFHQAAPPCQPQPVSCSTAATTMTMKREMGRNTFQPIRMSWS